MPTPTTITGFGLLLKNVKLQETLPLHALIV
jgi:hypothetical protein